MPANKANSIDNSNNNRISRRKRGLEPETTETSQSPAVKKLKPYEMSTNDMSAIKSLFADMKNDIEKKIGASQSSIETKLKELNANVNAEVNELKKSVDDLKSKVGAELQTLNKQITEHKQRLDNNEDDINRLKLSADLRLNGIPYAPNENLIELFHKIAIEIGYDSSMNTNVPLMKRIPIKDKITGIMVESSIISLHFASIQHKKRFYSIYLKKMPLKLSNIGPKTDMKVVIGESLTRLNAQIFKYAQGMKKEHKIAQVFTTDGLVKIKFVKGPNQRSYTIRHTSHLDSLLNEYAQQLHQRSTQNPTNQNVSPMHIDVNAHSSTAPNSTNYNRTMGDASQHPNARSSNSGPNENGAT